MMLECGCPGTFPEWDGKEIDLGGRMVHELAIPMFLHMPIAYELYRQRQQEELARLALAEPWPGLALTRTGFFRGRILRLLEEGTTPSRRVVRLPRPFHLYCRLHRGNVSTMRSTLREMQAQMLDRGKLPKALYLCHLTCPRCAAERGGEQILLLRRWVESPRLHRRTIGKG